MDDFKEKSGRFPGVKDNVDTYYLY